LILYILLNSGCYLCILDILLMYNMHLRIYFKNDNHLKGQCHEMNNFYLMSKHFNHYFLCVLWCFSGSFKSFFPTLYTIITFLFASLNLRMLTQTLLRIPFSVIGRCFLVTTSHWLSQVASCMDFQCQNRRFLESLKRVSRRIFKISKF
jgi:hypothetical protein